MPFTHLFHHMCTTTKVSSPKRTYTQTENTLSGPQNQHHILSPYIVLYIYTQCQTKHTSLQHQNFSKIMSRNTSDHLVDSTRVSPNKRRRTTNHHKAEMDHLFERLEWKSQIQNLQDQIDVLTAWRRGNCASGEPTTGTSSSDDHGGGASSPDDTRQQMPTDHPLYGFVKSCLLQTVWDSRAKCGDVKRRYDSWYAQETNDAGNRKLNHVRFSQAMRKYWPRKGCARRSYYEGIMLVAAGEETQPHVSWPLITTSPTAPHMMTYVPQHAPGIFPISSPTMRRHRHHPRHRPPTTTSPSTSSSSTNTNPQNQHN
jgi:hypothetical protein